MKKYLYIFKSNLMANLQYIGNIMIGFITYFMMIFIFLNLWQYIYSDSSELINGYSMNQMVWYVIITEVLWYATGGRKLCRKISEDVKSGNIAYNINKPYSYIGYSLSSHMSEAILKGILYSIAGVVIGLILLDPIKDFSLIAIPFITISMLLAIIINTLFVICIGLVSFWIEDSGPFYWVYSKLILVFGTLFPVEYFPSIVRPFLMLSPVYVTTYGPAKLFVDFSFTNLLVIILAQIIYLVIVLLLATFIYRKGVKRLNVNGG
jgi:ABC-type uncharacterized transport system, permease component